MTPARARFCAARRDRGRCRRALLLAGLLGGWFLLGCASPRKAPPAGESLAVEAQITNTDPCAMRLHDISGALLLYFFHNYELPERLSDLPPMQADGPLPPLQCPVTGAPYIYDPDGIFMPERNSWVVLYDPAPVHSRMRWAVTVQQPPEETEMLITKVIALPESFFALRPPQ